MLWSRLLLPCMDVEQKNCYFCVCHLNGLLIFTVSCKSNDRKRAGGQSQPSLYSGQDTEWKIAQIHHFQCGNQWGHAEKWGLPSISWQSQFPLMTLSQGQKDTGFSGFPKHFSFPELRDLLQFTAMIRTKCRMVLTIC